MKMFVKPDSIYLHRDVVDFRKSIDGLVAIVESELKRDVYTGALFLFCNKAKDKLKLVYWDKTGFALWYKRLEKHKFKWPSQLDELEFELTEQQLIGLLSGYDVLGHQALRYQSDLEEIE
ncbi:IS66 family insertion sequence element accessory protein TnpB [Rheinheimera salexigens]|uniref:Transposase n=1 Tax=Rheinheimera salexigens TaxID=1628148 RepID=A0A1E7Q7H0_9GAMM|nr:IS66 family insertion sequence element accessory protein TnpB [Rheinheimera salexigens]OEY70077.1 transposase [Rheinheimera salexigens]